MYIKQQITSLLVLLTISSSILHNTTASQMPNESLFEFPRNRQILFQTRILGGAEVNPAHSYPFQVAIYVSVSSVWYLCGGTLITSQWVLTAAHCVDDADYALVMLGAHDLSSEEDERVTLTSSQFVIHENWSEDTLQNDIALVKLPQNVSLNEFIGLVAISESNESFAYQNSEMLGWGLTSSGSVSSVLKYLNSTIMTNEECAAIDPFQTIIVSSQLCTSGAGNVGSCNGDSGGPLLVDGVQVGIVSFGYSSCTVGKPSVFTRVTDFLEWISENAVYIQQESKNGIGKLGFDLILVFPVIFLHSFILKHQ